MAKITYFDFCGFALLGLFVFVCIVCGLTIVREFFSSGYFVKTSCTLEEIRDVGLFQCDTCGDKNPTDQYGLSGCLQSSFPCIQVHVRYFNGHMDKRVIGVIHSSDRQLGNVPQCSHHHCSRNLTENKREVRNFVNSYKSEEKGKEQFRCYYDPNRPTWVLATTSLKWQPVFHCLFWPGLAALMTMSCLCCRLYLWERLPCRKTKPRTRTAIPKQLSPLPNITPNDISSKSPTEDVFSSLRDLPAISPAPSFKSIDMSVSSQYLTHSLASIYWSYPSLAAQSNGPSLATSTASFRTALEQIEDDERHTDDNEEDDDVSFSSIATSKRDLNAPVDTCDTGNTFQIMTSKHKSDIPLTAGRVQEDDDVWVKRPGFRHFSQSTQIRQPLEAQPTENAHKYAKSNGIPLGIKRFKNKSLIVGDQEKSKRADKQATDKSTKDVLNSSF